jgi:hypothetical protein
MSESKKSPAARALFQMQFAVQMINCGRIETANKCFTNAENALNEIINEENQDVTPELTRENVG